MLPSSTFHNANEQMRDQLLKIADFLVTSVDTKSGNLSTANSFSEPLQVYGTGKAMLFLSGNFTANISLQCSPSTSAIPSTWYDLATYTNIGAKVVDTGIACSLRVGVKTDNYTSGTINYYLKTGGRP